MNLLDNVRLVRTARAAAVLLAAVAVALAARATYAQDSEFFFPMVGGGSPPAPACDIPGSDYHSLPIIGPPLKGDMDTDENVNLGYRGYEQVNAERKLVVLGPVHDRDAPQFPAMFADRRTPKFTNTYQRYRWNEDCDCPLDTYSRWDATVLGMGVTPGEVIHTPDSRYDIGGGYEYLVMYAAETRITLHIGREDEFPGYVIHIEDVCTDPELLALYRRLDDRGRGELPVLRGRQAFGRATGNEIKIAVRDTGSFMDPRSRNDWWQGQ